MKKIALTIAVGLLGLFGAIAISSPAAASTGGVNVAGWCAFPNNQRGYNFTKAYPTDPHNGFTWVCLYTKATDARVTKTTGVDMNAACAYTFPQSPGDAVLQWYDDAYSWYCIY